MHKSHWPIRLLCASLASAVASSVISSASAQPTPVLRKMPADSIWRRVWAIGGDSTSDAFVEPRQIVATGGLAVILDAGTREVRALDARTGALRFVVKPTGEGPGEFRRPSFIASTPTGFAVLDQADARLTAYDRLGKFLWTTVVPDVFTINGLCVYGDSRTPTRIVATHSRRDSSLVEIDTAGRQAVKRSIPWREAVRGAVGFAYSHVTSNASARGECVVAPLFGSEWGLVATGGPARAFRVIEPGAQPVVETSRRILDRSLTSAVIESTQQSDTPQASRGALIIGDTAIVYAARTKTFPLRWLDYYRASTGAYLYSRKLPFIANGIAIGDDGTIFATSIGTTSNVIVALRPATVVDALQKKR